VFQSILLQSCTLTLAGLLVLIITHSKTILALAGSSCIAPALHGYLFSPLDSYEVFGEPEGRLESFLRAIHRLLQN
jgi:hypothetical protein